MVLDRGILRWKGNIFPIWTYRSISPKSCRGNKLFRSFWGLITCLMSKLTLLRLSYQILSQSKSNCPQIRQFREFLSSDFNTFQNIFYLKKS